jgi:PleD family two-component response regulator
MEKAHIDWVECLRPAIAAMSLHGVFWPISASTGVGGGVPKTKHNLSLAEEADQAVSQAKRTGRNRWCRLSRESAGWWHRQMPPSKDR